MEFTPLDRDVTSSEKLKIPVVHHIITDENAGYTQVCLKFIFDFYENLFLCHIFNL